MSSDSINLIITEFKKLKRYEKKIILNKLYNIITEINIDDERDLNISCPFCNSNEKWKNGKLKERQRYLCKKCHKSYNSFTNTPISYTKKDMVLWKAYLEDLLNQVSLRKSAQKLGISLSTAFFWRHRILDSIRENLPISSLEGVIEMDETYFNESFKGNHNKSTFVMPRAPHKRGKSLVYRRVNKEKVCIVTALDSNSSISINMCCLGPSRSSDLIRVFENKVNKNSLLVTDSHKSYKKLASYFILNHKEIPTGKRFIDEYNLKRSKILHRKIKGFMYIYKGVSTKYLQNYLSLFKFIMEDKKESPLFNKGKSPYRNRNFKGRLPLYN